MLGKRENRETLENDKDYNDKPKKYSKLSINDSISNENIIAVKSNLSTFACAFYGSILINKDRNLVSFGKGEYGNLGHENTNSIINPPKQISNLKELKMVDCGDTHTVCVDYDGNLFTFGNNNTGRLGVGKDKDTLPFTHIPQKINNIPSIDSISCGYDFTICTSNDRICYSFGGNVYGQLGIGNNIESYSSPQLISDLNDIEFISCGGNHVICKTYSNEYYSWGYNRYGQLGQGNDYDYNKPHKCSNWPEDIVDIKCGDFHTLLLTCTGYIYSLGDNNQGQLGLNEDIELMKSMPTLIKDIPLIKRIECGADHSMCIDTNNNLWVFGDNECGQLGLGDKENRDKPTLNESLHDITDISSGNHTFVKSINNKIYAFGFNNDMQIEKEISEEYIFTPIQVFKDKKDIWASNIFKTKQKSARK